MSLNYMYVDCRTSDIFGMRFELAIERLVRVYFLINPLLELDAFAEVHYVSDRVAEHEEASEGSIVRRWLHWSADRRTTFIENPGDYMISAV